MEEVKGVALMEGDGLERGGRRGKWVKPDPPVPFFVVWEAGLGAGLTGHVMDLQPEPAGLGAILGRTFDVGGRTPARGSRPRPGSDAVIHRTKKLAPIAGRISDVTFC